MKTVAMEKEGRLALFNESEVDFMTSQGWIKRVKETVKPVVNKAKKEVK